MAETTQGINMRAVANFIRWTCRILGSLLALFVISFFVGHLFENDTQTVGYVFRFQDYLMFAGLGLMVAGMIIGWFWELWAFILTTLGFLLFTVTNYIASGFFPIIALLVIFLIIGFGYLVVWLIDRRVKQEAKSF